MKVLKKFRLRTQMMVCFFLVIFVFILTGFFSIRSMQILKDISASQLKITDIKIAVLEARRYEKNFLLDGGEEAIHKVHEHIDGIQSIAESETNKKHSCETTRLLLKKIMDQSVRYKKNFNKLISMDQADNISLHDTAKDKKLLIANVVAIARNILLINEDLLKIQEAAMQDIRYKTMALIIFTLILYISMATVVNFLVTRGILFPLRRCADFARTIAMGNLKSSLKIDFAGSAVILAESLNVMQSQLKQRIGFAEGILNGVSPPFAVIDKHEKISYLNYAMLELLEIEGNKESHMGRLWADFVYDDIDKETIMGKALKERRSEKNILMSLQTRKGNIRHLQVDINPLYDLDGNLMGSFCIITDLTTIRKNQADLRKANLCLKSKTDELELLLNNIDTQVWYVYNNMYMFANAARLKFMGKNFDEIKDKSIYDFRPEEEVDKLTCYNNEVMKTKDAVHFQEWFFDGIQNRRLLSVSKVPKLDAGRNVEFIITTATDITEQKLLEQQLKYKCYHDQLTDLYNRHYLIEEIERLRKSRLFPLGIIFCDVDDMKLINDTLGHEFGDKLLKNIAMLMKECFRSNDMVARYGGDEFVILQPESSDKDVLNAVTRFKLKIEQYNNNNTELPINISIGYIVSKNKEEPVKNILASADNLMYQEKIAKKQGEKAFFKLEGLLKALEARDYMTENHGVRMGKRITKMCRSLEISKATKHNFLLLAIFHDIGKIGIPDKILFKPGPLDETEWMKMKEHTRIGYRIAKSTPELSHIADWILYHHEKYDGSGYPSGLMGKNIPLACRILAIVDAYDAMTSDRVYRKAMSHENAMAELKNESGAQFDPLLVKKFIQILKTEFVPC